MALTDSPDSVLVPQVVRPVLVLRHAQTGSAKGPGGEAARRQKTAVLHRLRCSHPAETEGDTYFDKALPGPAAGDDFENGPLKLS